MNNPIEYIKQLEAKVEAYADLVEVLREQIPVIVKSSEQLSEAIGRLKAAAEAIK